MTTRTARRGAREFALRALYEWQLSHNDVRDIRALLEHGALQQPQHQARAVQRRGRGEALRRALVVARGRGAKGRGPALRVARVARKLRVNGGQHKGPMPEHGEEVAKEAEEAGRELVQRRPRKNAQDKGHRGQPHAPGSERGRKLRLWDAGLRVC